MVTVAPLSRLLCPYNHSRRVVTADSGRHNTSYLLSASLLGTVHHALHA